ncbi:hypothetical protein T265_01802 [Opisthorchis viverrini]|uniref:Uncharacterized protein n=1 Tax=Opisthorchis viverrini TaxID=6198 RepID=A0A074ZY60_OPIVI|nr:hypothetical protein T265_01802 [Opisthorchis viverrini]KER32021.1 hypothetical protein T265_01802 [Opisthorchis viverrini]
MVSGQTRTQLDVTFCADGKENGSANTFSTDHCTLIDTRKVIIIIIIDSMTSVFNTNASLSYNHDLFESLIVKKRIKVDGGET